MTEKKKVWVSFLTYLREDQKEALQKASDQSGLSIAYMLRQGADMYIAEFLAKEKLRKDKLK